MTARWFSHDGGWGRSPATSPLALFVALALVGCDGWTLFEQAPARPPDGKPFSLKVHGARACSAKPQEAEAAPAPELLGVEVEVSGWHPGGVPANFFYASLRDGEGRLYRALPLGCEPYFEGPPLAPGQKTRGFLTFPKPPGGADAQRSFRLVYAPRLTGSGGANAEARIELPLSSL